MCRHADSVQPERSSLTVRDILDKLTAEDEKAVREPQRASQGHVYIESNNEGDGLPSLQADWLASREKDYTLSIVTSRARKTELRLRNMKDSLARELDTERRRRLQKGIAEYEIRLDELKKIEAAAAGR